MDVQSIATLFGSTLSPDPNVRKASEAQIKTIGDQGGALSALMQVVGNESIDVAIRQSVAVYLKNRVTRSWHVRPEREATTKPISDSEKTFIKSHILQLLTAAPSRPLQVQLAALLKTIITHEFPEQWPGLIDEILAMIRSGDPRAAYGGVFAILEVVKSARFRIENNIMPQVAEKVFPTLVELGSSIASTLTPQNADMLHLILKTYRHSTQTSLSPHQQSHDSIVAWGRLLFSVVTIQLPSGSSLPGTKDEWEKSEWWKAKKWAFNTLDRLFERYGNPSQLPPSMKKEISGFAEHFVGNFAPAIFRLYLTQAEAFARGEIWLSNKVLSAIFRFFTTCIKPKSTWAILKPHVNDIVSGFVFPQLVWDEELAEVWQSDPVEFIRLNLEMDDFVSPSAAALSFVVQLATSRYKSTFPGIISFVKSVMENTATTPQQKYGVLSLVSALGAIILDNKGTFKDEIEQFVGRFVVPELSSGHAYLRYVACDVLSTLERFEMKWKDEASLLTTANSVTSCVKDPELPVRVGAILALRDLIKHDAVQKALSPHVGDVMNVLFTMSDETDLDYISDAMESFIQRFKDELIPASIQIVDRLCQNYLRLMDEHIAIEAKSNPTGGPSDFSADSTLVSDQSEDKVMAMMGIAKTIETVVYALESVEPKPKDTLVYVQELVIPIINLTMQKEVIDLFDTMFSLVDIFTFTMKSIAPKMWVIFEKMHQLFKTIAIDYLDDMIPALDNFIDFGKDIIGSRQDYQTMVLDFCHTALTSTQLGDTDRIGGMALGESILLNLRYKVDAAIPTLVEAAIQIHTVPNQNRRLRIELLNFFINLILYNPAITLPLLESRNLARPIFDEWFAAVRSEGGKSLPRAHDKRLSVVALCALMEIDVSVVPISLREGWPSIVGAILEVFKTLPEAIARREELEKIENGDFDEAGEEDDDLDALAGVVNQINDTNDDDDVWDEDNDYIEMLHDESIRLRGQRRAGAPGAEGDIEDVDLDAAIIDDDSDDDEDDELEEELNVETPLERVNPWVTFKQSLTNFQLKNPIGYQASTTILTPEQQTLMMEVMTRAQDEETKAAAVTA